MGHEFSCYIVEFITVASATLLIWIIIWILPSWIEERSCCSMYLFLLLPILLTESLCVMLYCQPKIFACQVAVSSSCSYLMNNGNERFWEFTWVRARSINQGYNVVKQSPLYWSCFLLWVRSLWLVTFFSVWQIHHFEYLADLQFEGRLHCLLLIWEGHKAFFFTLLSMS